MTEVQLSLRSYAKILSHVVQYPYTAVNGVLLTPATAPGREEEEEEEEGDVGRKEEQERVEVVDAVPLFHYNIPLSPMLTVALTQIEEYATNRGLRICGYYHANEFHSDNDIGFVAARIADRIAENSEEGACLLLVNNEKLNHIATDLPFKLFFPVRSTDRIDWKEGEKPTLQFGERGLTIGPEIMKEQLYRSVVDMDSHYDDVRCHWDNSALNEAVNLFTESLPDLPTAEE